MTISEVYQKITSHQIHGMMLHDDLANYYDFLGLKGYKRCHEYHYLSEACSFRRINRYYVNHHSKLIPKADPDYTSVIPSSWYNYTREDVDENTKKNATRNGMNEWVTWEREAKKLYEDCYNELIALGEVASANKIATLMLDVDEELKIAERYMLNAEVLGYDMLWIVSEQEHLHDKYEKMVKDNTEIFAC